MPSSRGSSQPRDSTQVSCLLHQQACSLPLAPPGKPRPPMWHQHQHIRNLEIKEDCSVSSILRQEDIEHLPANFPIQVHLLTLRISHLPQLQKHGENTSDLASLFTCYPQEVMRLERASYVLEHSYPDGNSSLLTHLLLYLSPYSLFSTSRKMFLNIKVLNLNSVQNQ